MGARELRALRAAIAAGTFAPVYYIHGDDEYRKDALVRSLIAAAVEAATRDFNLDTIRGAEAGGESLESMLQTPPMMAARRVVVVRDTGSLRKDVRATLERYVRAPSPSTVLVLVALAGTKEEKLLTTGTTVVQVQPLGDAELGEWIVEHLRETHGATITKAASDVLTEAVDADTVLLAGELDKLVSYTQGQEIGEQAVRDVVGIRQGESLGDLLDAVAARDVRVALDLVPRILSQPRNNAVSVIMALTVQTLALAWGRHARSRGLAAHQLEREYFTLLKETSAFPMRPWGEAAKCWARHLQRWDASALDEAMRALRLADQSAKDTRFSSDEQLLSTLVCAMCAGPSRAAA